MIDVFGELYRQKKKLAAFGVDEAPLLKAAYERFNDESNGATNIMSGSRVMPRSTVLFHLFSLAGLLGAKTKSEKFDRIRSAMNDVSSDALLLPSAGCNARETEAAFKRLARLFGQGAELEHRIYLAAVQSGVFKKKVVAASCLGSRYAVEFEDVVKSELGRASKEDWEDHYLMSLSDTTRANHVLCGYACADDVLCALRRATVELGPRFDSYGTLAALIERERI